MRKEGINRRDFLKLVSGAAVGFLAGHKMQDTVAPGPTNTFENTHDQTLPEPNTEQTHNSIEPESSVEYQEVAPERAHITMSNELRREIDQLKIDLIEKRGAQEIFERARQTNIAGLYTVFRNGIRNSEKFDTINTPISDLFADIAIYGQIAAESAWNTDIGNTQTSAQGLWQFLRDARTDINRKRNSDEFDPFDPEDATLGAVEYYELLMDYGVDEIDALAKEHRLLDSEFTLPLLMTAYHSGGNKMKQTVQSYLHVGGKLEPGLDCAMNIICHGSPDEFINNEGRTYFLKCLAFKELYEELDTA